MSKDNVTKPADKSVSEKIWEDIKDRSVSMFALKGQTVKDFCSYLPADPNKCFLVPKASSLVAALEEALGDRYQLEQTEKYIIVSKVK